MVKILLHHILSILQIHTIIRDSPAQQDPLPQASSQGSQDPLVQLLVLAALSPDNKDMEIQDQVSGPAWERGESWDICSAAIERRHPFQTPGPTHLIAPHTPARGVARLTHHFVEAQVALQHVQVQRQKPEQHQDMVVPEDDKKVKSWSQTLDAKFLIFHRFLLKSRVLPANNWGRGILKNSMVFCLVQLFVFYHLVRLRVDNMTKSLCRKLC